MIVRQTTDDLYGAPIKAAGNLISFGLRDMGCGVVVRLWAPWWSQTPLASILALGRGIIQAIGEDLIVVPSYQLIPVVDRK